MTLSRTARILLAMLLMAAAAFVWVNFFAAGPAPSAPIVDVPQTPAPATTSASSAPPSGAPASVAPASGEPAVGAPAVGAPAVGASTSAASAPETPPPSTQTGADGTDAATDGTDVSAVDVDVDAAVATDDANRAVVVVTSSTPADSEDLPAPTVVTGATSVTVSNVQVLSLPFLVTEPPPPDQLAIDGRPIELGPRMAADAPAPIRLSVNPFSPIVLPAVAEVPEPETPVVVEVAVPILPTAEEILASRSAVADLTPRALTPRSPNVVSLPRSLPTGGVLAAPSILTAPRGGGRAEDSTTARLSPPTLEVVVPTVRIDPATPTTPSMALPPASIDEDDSATPPILSRPLVQTAGGSNLTTASAERPEGVAVGFVAPSARVPETTPNDPVASLPRSLDPQVDVVVPDLLSAPRLGAAGVGDAASTNSNLQTESPGQPQGMAAGFVAPSARVPETTPNDPVASLPRSLDPQVDVVVPDLLSAPRLGAAGVGDDASTRPLPRSSAARNALEAYVLEQDVAFTGSVLGNVAVGVFRIGGYASPVVISLGQTLLDTEIVLTNVGSQSAELTLGDLTYVLTLEPGR